MVEDDDGDFTPEFRWHDATASSAEHTLGVLMTHDGELRVRFCRGYVPRADKAIRAACARARPGHARAGRPRDVEPSVVARG